MGFGWGLPPGCTHQDIDDAMGCETSAEEDARLEREEREERERAEDEENEDDDA